MGVFPVPGSKSNPPTKIGENMYSYMANKIRMKKYYMDRIWYSPTASSNGGSRLRSNGGRNSSSGPMFKSMYDVSLEAHVLDKK